jgi:hypothetical protein
MGRTSENQPQKASGASCALKQKKLKIQKLDKKNSLTTELGRFIDKIKSIHSKKSTLPNMLPFLELFIS